MAVRILLLPEQEMSAEMRADRRREELIVRTRKSRNRENSMLSNYWYLYKGWFQDSRWNMLYVILYLTGGVLSLCVGLYIPKIAVWLVMEQASVQRMLGTLAAVGILYFLLLVMQDAGSRLTNAPCHRYRRILQEKILDKTCRTSYSDLEDPDYKAMIERAKQLYEYWNRDVFACIGGSMSFLLLLITIPITAGVLVTLHPALVLIMAAGAWLRYRLNRRSIAWKKKNRDSWIPIERRIDYISGKMVDFSYAKELRLYGADNWLLAKYRKLFRDRGQWMRKQVRQETWVGVLQQAVGLASQIAVYAFLITGVLGGEIGADDFLLYLSFSLSLGNSLNEIAWQTGQMKENMLSISDYRKMMSMPDSGRRVKTDAAAYPVSGGPEITFSHVSFTYPGAEERTLEDIHFTIWPGEKIALVGLNGAGKTTLIKLLCGMYEPTEGEILLNGRSAVRWELEEWYRIFSVVFQDIGVIPATIAENVSACPLEETDREQVKKCLEQAGLWKLVESLPQGMDTCLEKELFREGVNLSGGETQKLLLARAIYRNAPVLVLDEPTSALDAIAENQLYLRYNELTRDRTSLFISHRLASTRFCDRILMLENGRITEEGSHKELLDKKGAYYQLFQVQSHYYQEDRNMDFSSDMDPSWEVSSYVSE